MSSQGGDMSSQGGDMSSQGGDVSSDQEEPSTAETQNGQLMPEPCRLSLDPETASSWLLLSEDLQKITVSDRWLNYPDNPQRFNGVLQVLCREGLSGRHRFDVDWMSADNRHAVGVALAYRSVPRKGTLRAPFGCNAASWFFAAERDALIARHDGQEWSYDVPDDGYDRVRVCLDHDGGVLSFYLLSQGVLRHVHTFRAKFTQPLHPGLCAGFTSSFAAFC
ncbi:stonustoxin subunit alpha isoform X2 [Fundulus heteroclitus]|nr:stonustoxin subunit alpha isoform X2 [Fundulus heteroclitus]XP_035993569.1 stonustoxin subunit alpha isoform X2 [Fundulus heteroclitus]XP_035993570.1 stonustoxin subunit alpha isoform X2 [Fundulus heteroclitus]